MKRKGLVIMTVLVLCSAIVVGATLAMFNAYEEKTNEFVFDDGSGGSDPRIGIELRETLWTNENFKDESPDAPIGYNPDTGAYDKYGEEIAKNFVPNRVIPKNPRIKSIGIEKVYVGMIVKCDPDPLKSTHPLSYVEDHFVDINWTTAPGKWKEVNLNSSGNPNNRDRRYFIYETALSKGDKTDALFTSVTIKGDIADSGNPNQITDSDKWDIEIHAYAVQEESFANAEEALIAQFGTGNTQFTGAGAGDWDY